MRCWVRTVDYINEKRRVQPLEHLWTEFMLAVLIILISGLAVLALGDKI